MAILSLLKEPDERLRKKSLPVAYVTDDIRQLLDDMVDTMCASKGMGLAAPQVNVHKRVVVMQVHKKIFKFINPELVWQSTVDKPYEEGCLSVPGYSAVVFRPSEVIVRFLDLEGLPQEQSFSGLEATCIQHEIDHLEGILFIDHLSFLKQLIVRKKLARQMA